VSPTLTLSSKGVEVRIKKSALTPGEGETVFAFGQDPGVGFAMVQRFTDKIKPLHEMGTSPHSIEPVA
jgi:hypothetical protein